ncbi:spermidine synthase [Nonomuraea sp. SYSU D8015]|uniref:spermidine synthase n=1 Tax=Nonomuraea sp. SYSU D8015 TaxID=2593644 RepID=UPI0016605CAE|nr:spermidine synthase [Nonomuraea sp. SYSU D8015]
MTRNATETLSPGLTRTWTITDVVYEAKTPYQQVLIGDTPHGRTLFCGDADAMERQSSELSQLLYHEALMVPPLALAPARPRVLIIGSSEGVASQIARRAGAAHVDHVDIDLECVRACAEHLPYGYTLADVEAALAGDGQVRLHAEDGHQFVLARLADGTRYDVIVVDLPDEAPDSDAQHNRLYARDFLSRCKDLLTAGGVVSTQAGCPTLWRQDTLRRALTRFNELFPSVLCFNAWEHEWSFITGAPHASDYPLSTLLQRRLSTLPYRPETMDTVSAASATILPYHLRPAMVPLPTPATVREP